MPTLLGIDIGGTGMKGAPVGSTPRSFANASSGMPATVTSDQVSTSESPCSPTT